MFVVALIGVVASVIGYVSLFGSKTYTVHQSGIVVITGASIGIGRHAAEHLAQKYKSYLVLAGVRRASDAESIRDMRISNLQPIIIDVYRSDSTGLAFAAVQQRQNHQYIEHGWRLIGAIVEQLCSE